MAKIHNEILIQAPIEEIWDALTNLELLEKYDPTVKKVSHNLNSKDECWRSKTS